MFSDFSIQDIGIIIVSIIISLGCHEAMHAYTAHALGDRTAEDEGRLTLNPLKHIDLMTTIILPIALLLFGLPPLFIARPVPFNPHNVRYAEYGAALMALAGPFTNLALAFLGSLLIRFIGVDGGQIISALAIFMQVNIAFFVFNMIPIPPLDGSRLLFAFAPEPLQRVMARLEQAGFVTIIVIFVVLIPIIGPTLSHINQTIFTFLLS